MWPSADENEPNLPALRADYFRQILAGVPMRTVGTQTDVESTDVSTQLDEVPSADVLVYDMPYLDFLDEIEDFIRSPPLVPGNFPAVPLEAVLAGMADDPFMGLEVSEEVTADLELLGENDLAGESSGMESIQVSVDVGQVASTFALAEASWPASDPTQAAVGSETHTTGEAEVQCSEALLVPAENVYTESCFSVAMEALAEARSPADAASYAEIVRDAGSSEGGTEYDPLQGDLRSRSPKPISLP